MFTKESMYSERGLRKIPILFEAGWDSSLFWISTPLSSRHLWVLSIPLNTSVASFTESLTKPGSSSLVLREKQGLTSAAPDRVLTGPVYQPTTRRRRVQLRRMSTTLPAFDTDDGLASGVTELHSDVSRCDPATSVRYPLLAARQAGLG